MEKEPKKGRAESEVAAEQEPGVPVGVDSRPSLEPNRVNEDAAFFDPTSNSIGVFDGLGGAAAGEVAAAETKDFIVNELRKFPTDMSPAEMQDEIKDILRVASERLLDMAIGRPELKGMGTTATIMKLTGYRDGWWNAIVGHVGDTRLYILRKDGFLEQVTRDDSLIREYIHDPVDAGAVERKLSEVVDPSTLEPQEQILFHSRNIVTQSIGSNVRRVRPTVFSIQIEEGEIAVLATDGVHDNLTHTEITEILRQAKDPDQAAQTLTRTAEVRSMGGHARSKRDDSTAVVVKFPVRKTESSKSS